MISYNLYFVKTPLRLLKRIIYFVMFNKTVMIVSVVFGFFFFFFDFWFLVLSFSMVFDLCILVWNYFSSKLLFFYKLKWFILIQYNKMLIKYIEVYIFPVKCINILKIIKKRNIYYFFTWVNNILPKQKHNINNKIKFT